MPEPASTPLPSPRPPHDDSSSRGFRRWFSGNRVSRAEESALLRGFFDHRTDGIYVDVGANDPFLGSTSWLVEETGWSGVLVEPIPALAERLRRERKGRVFNCACSGRQDAGKRLQFWIHPGNPGWSTFHRDASPWFKDEAVEIEVEVRTLDSILEEAGVREGFELLAMDVEFHEIEVLEGLDLARWRPQLIFVEDHVHDHRLLRYLTEKGYRCHRRTGLNSWFIPVASPRPSSLWMKWGVFRKYYLGLPFRRIKRWYKGLLRR
jgi:FkbM family methyltransferase